MFRYSRSFSRTLFPFLLSLLLMAFLGCTKEMSYELPLDPDTNIPPPSSGDAVFTFIPGAGNCSDAITTGIFQEGVIPGADAKIKVTVNVMKKGSWMMITNVVNGILFMGTGVFTSTGIQVITLAPNGMPEAAGITNFLLKAGNVNCSVAVPVIPAGTIPDDYYYKITVDGLVHEQHVTTDNHYEAGSGLGGDDNVTISASINYSSDPDEPTPPGSTSFDITKGIMHNYASAVNEDFLGFFAPGNYPVVSSFSTDGVIITWVDEKGDTWDTASGTGDQTGSTFTIISAKDAPSYFNYYISVKMQFKCKLYNTKTGAMKQVTDGEMVGSFGKI